MYVFNFLWGGGLYNYGLVVDISIVDLLGYLLFMGIEVDYMDVVLYIINEVKLVREGKIM